MPASVTDAEWDALVMATGRDHILQQSGWATLKAATGWHATRFTLAEDGDPVGVCQVLSRSLPLGLSVAYAPRGPLVDPARLALALGALRRALAVTRCASLLCDPEIPDAADTVRSLAGGGVARSPIFVQPRRTLLMDLSLEPDVLLAAMRRKTRQYVHKAERAGVVTEETSDIDRFLAVLRAVAARDRFGIHDRDYFERLLRAFPGRAHLLMARLGGEDDGALLVVRSGERAWEMFGGWSGAHADARPFYLLKWRSLLLMRGLGVRRYDMWGLADRPLATTSQSQTGRQARHFQAVRNGVGDMRGSGGAGAAASDVDGLAVSDSADLGAAPSSGASSPMAQAPLAGVENFKLGFGGEVAEWIGALETPVRRALFPLWQLGARRRLARSA
ncbi:MAG: lipid II:glycine glycyltransferase FemX [Candidatus Limnocylindria bacterium]